jgi:hypothetical protein
MKQYRLLKPIHLTNAAAEQLGLNNRIYQVGEIMEFPDGMVQPWLKKGTVEVWEPPKPDLPEPVAPPAKKAPTPKKTTASKTEKSEEAK